MTDNSSNDNNGIDNRLTCECDECVLYRKVNNILMFPKKDLVAKPLKEDKESATKPYWAGYVHCIGCKHEWVDLAPVGSEWVDCPECGLPKGTPKFPFAGDENEPTLTCSSCDGYVLTAFIRNDNVKVMCMACGTDLTDAFYDD